MHKFKEIDVAELEGMVDAGAAAIRLIDVRNPGEVARGCLPQAENLPLHTLPLQADSISPEDTLVFYCQTGARSAQACAFMASRGFARVYNLRGGIVAWMQSGRPVG